MNVQVFLVTDGVCKYTVFNSEYVSLQVNCMQ